MRPEVQRRQTHASNAFHRHTTAQKLLQRDRARTNICLRSIGPGWRESENVSGENRKMSPERIGKCLRRESESLWAGEGALRTLAGTQAVGMRLLVVVCCMIAARGAPDIMACSACQGRGQRLGGAASRTVDRTYVYDSLLSGIAQLSRRRFTRAVRAHIVTPGSWSHS